MIRCQKYAREKLNLKLPDTGEILGNNCNVMEVIELLKKMKVSDKILTTITVARGQ